MATWTIWAAWSSTPASRSRSPSPEQAADVVAFLEPESEAPAEPASEAASLRARAATLSRRIPTLRGGALGVPGQRGKVSWELEGYPEVRAPLSLRGTPNLQA